MHFVIAITSSVKTFELTIQILHISFEEREE